MGSGENSGASGVKEEYYEVTLRVQKLGVPDFYLTMKLKRDEPMPKLMTTFCDYLKQGASRVKEEEDEKVTLRVQVQHVAYSNLCLTMKLKRDQPMRKLMTTFCEYLKLGDYKEVPFAWDGNRLRGRETPDELELENDDVIDVFPYHGEVGSTAATYFKFSYPVQILISID